MGVALNVESISTKARQTRVYRHEKHKQAISTLHNILVKVDLSVFYCHVQDRKPHHSPNTYYIQYIVCLILSSLRYNLYTLATPTDRKYAFCIRMRILNIGKASRFSCVVVHRNVHILDRSIARK